MGCSFSTGAQKIEAVLQRFDGVALELPDDGNGTEKVRALPSLSPPRRRRPSAANVRLRPVCVRPLGDVVSYLRFILRGAGARAGT